ncbi:ABC transporter permease [Mycobacterium sp. MS1601]|nr:ABC transporter permease [Mycobacterium sp. MS1601]
MRTAAMYLGPTVTVAAVIVLWQFWVTAAGIKPFVLPAPVAVWQTFIERPAFFFGLGVNTLQEALAGLVFGCVAGTVTALAVFRTKGLSQVTEAMAAALLALPMVALVPLSNVFFGLTPASRIFVVSVAVYPIAVSFLLTGLRGTDQGLIEAFRSMAISPMKTTVALYVPSMLPSAMSALRVAVPTAFSIAIVAEFFGGELTTLGTFIKSTAVQSRVADMWGAALVAFLFALVLYLALSLVDRWALRWHSSRQPS